LVDVWSDSSRADQDIVVVDLFFQKFSPKADIVERGRDVRFVPEADINGSFAHLVGAGEQRLVIAAGRVAKSVGNQTTGVAIGYKLLFSSH